MSPHDVDVDVDDVVVDADVVRMLLVLYLLYTIAPDFSRVFCLAYSPSVLYVAPTVTSSLTRPSLLCAPTQPQAQTQTQNVSYALEDYPPRCLVSSESHVILLSCSCLRFTACYCEPLRDRYVRAVASVCACFMRKHCMTTATSRLASLRTYSQRHTSVSGVGRDPSMTSV